MPLTPLLVRRYAVAPGERDHHGAHGLVQGAAARGAPADGARRWAELPANAVKYIRRVEELTKMPVTLLSTSPEREDAILVKDPFDCS